MENGSTDRYRLAQALRTRSGAIGAAAAAVVVAGVAGAFAYTSGFLSPDRLTQGRVIDRFEQVDGPHPGFRRNHAKGVCFSGWFDSDGAAQSLSSAVVFRPGRTPIFGRFALAGGQPYQADAAETVRSMAVDFQLADGEVWRTGINNIPVFPFRDIRSFYEQLAATAPDPRTGKPNPLRLAQFFAAHPESARAIALIKAQPPTSGFADATYNSLNAFVFVNAAGRATPVRWSMVPEDAVQAPAPIGAADRNALFDRLISRVEHGPLRYRLMVTVGQPGDPTNDATRAWPAIRPQVQAGVLTIDKVQDETRGACRDVTFDPLILPRGIGPSDDPVLSARSATYAQSFRRRAGEPAPHPAVVIPATQPSASPQEGARP
jgi:catalase